MSDNIDQLTQLEDSLLEMRIKAIRNKVNSAPTPVFTGKCRNCEYPIEVGSFCEKACLDDFERHKRKWR